MQQAREARLDQIVFDPLRQTLDPREQLGGEGALAMRFARHIEEPMVAKERHPERRLRIWLPERPDQRVAVVAVPLATRGVQACDRLGGVMLDAGVILPSFGMKSITRRSLSK